MTGTRRFTDGGGWQDQAGYSRAVRRGNIIMISGTTATGPDGTAVHRGDTGAQARLCLSRIEQALSALGGCLDDIVQTVVYLAPGASWEEASGAHLELLGDIAPANTTLYVHGLVGSGLLAEVEVDAWAGPAS